MVSGVVLKCNSHTLSPALEIFYRLSWVFIDRAVEKFPVTIIANSLIS